MWNMAIFWGKIRFFSLCVPRTVSQQNKVFLDFKYYKTIYKENVFKFLIFI